MRSYIDIVYNPLKIATNICTTILKVKCLKYPEMPFILVESVFWWKYSFQVYNPLKLATTTNISVIPGVTRIFPVSESIEFFYKDILSI